MITTYGGNITDRILTVTQSETLAEALAKLTEARQLVADDTTGTIDGVEPWETRSGALQRLDHEIGVVENEMLEEQIAEHV